MWGEPSVPSQLICLTLDWVISVEALDSNIVLCSALYSYNVLPPRCINGCQQIQVASPPEKRSEKKLAFLYFVEQMASI